MNFGKPLITPFYRTFPGDYYFRRAFLEVNRKKKPVLNLMNDRRKDEACFTSHSIVKLVYYIFICVSNPACIYLFKVSSGKPRAMWEICSKLRMRIPEQHP